LRSKKIFHISYNRVFTYHSQYPFKSGPTSASPQPQKGIKLHLRNNWKIQVDGKIDKYHKKLFWEAEKGRAYPALLFPLQSPKMGKIANYPPPYCST